jgi:hypothetical protein
MARRVFFSFHYEADSWRAGQVRNCWITKPDRDSAGFWDASAWEEVKRKGEHAVKGWIDQQLKGTSVTIVLIGAQTAGRPYVRYEIARSHFRGNGLLGLYIDKCEDQAGSCCQRGEDPFSKLYVQNGAGKQYLNTIYPTYDWVAQRGYENLASWIESAAAAASR